MTSAKTLHQPEQPAARWDAPAVCLRAVSFAYEGAPVIEKADFDIFAGDFVCVVGPNGGGKTTLLKLVTGELEPDTGEVRVFGRAPAAVRHRVGYTPQYLRFDALFPVSVLDVVLMGRLDHHWFGRYHRRDREAALRALDEVGLADASRRHFSELSGGQRQRVLIARGLVCAPDLLVLDEPTANVDAAVGAKLLDLLARLNERITILMVSHDLRFVSGHVGTVLCVNRKIVAHPTSEVTAEIINELYGGGVRVVRHDHQAPQEPHHHG